MCQKTTALAAAGFFALTLLPAADASAQSHALIFNSLQGVHAKLNDMVVPFKVTDSTGGFCDSAGPGTSNPEIIIDSDGLDGEFVVTSILIKSTAPGAPETGLRNFNVSNVSINGEQFDTRTGNLVGPTDGFGVLESVDVMGTPVRRNGDADAPVQGGNFPHQIVAQSDGADDIRVVFFCSSVDDDFSFDTILVAGWKRRADTVTVTLVPGS